MLAVTLGPLIILAPLFLEDDDLLIARLVEDGRGDPRAFDQRRAE